MSSDRAWLRGDRTITRWPAILLLVTALLALSGCSALVELLAPTAAPPPAVAQAGSVPVATPTLHAGGTDGGQTSGGGAGTRPTATAQAEARPTARPEHPHAALRRPHAGDPVRAAAHSGGAN